MASSPSKVFPRQKQGSVFRSVYPYRIHFLPFYFSFPHLFCFFIGRETPFPATIPSRSLFMQLLYIELPVLIQAPVHPEDEKLRARLVGFPAFQVQADDREDALRQLRKNWERSLEDERPPFHRLSLALALSQATAEKVPVSWREKRTVLEGLTWLIRFPRYETGTAIHFPCLSECFFAIEKAEQEKAILQEVFKSKRGKKSRPLPKELLAQEKDRLAWLSTNLPVHAIPLKWQRNFWGFQAAGNQKQAGKEELQRLSTCLNDEFPSRLARSWYREEEVQQLEALLFDTAHRPVVAVGPEQSGRHSLIGEVLFRYLDRKPEAPARRFWQVDPNRLISGMSTVGQWEERLENILLYLHRPTENHPQPDVLILDHPLSLLRLGQSSSSRLSFADVLGAWMEKGLVKVVLTATPAQWNKLRERAPRFADLFLPFRLRSYNLEESLPMLIQKKRWLEQHYKKTFSVQALQEFIQLYRQYLQPRPLPGALASMMDAMARTHRSDELRAPEVQRWFFEQQGVARAQSFFYEQDRTATYRDLLQQGLKGQQQAVEALAQVLELIQSRCAPSGRPISTFLFVGPTGVGKTQAAKVLSQVLLGTETPLLRFDMNEYVDASAVERLLGSWNRPEGQLTSRVRFRPFGVLLLDEIEKAHPAVHDLLLQVLDEGRLTDAGGRTTYFHNLVIIMTSNLGVDRASRIPTFDKPEAQEQNLLYIREVERFFRPEFVNRIDEIVVFQPLSPEHILEIAQLQMEELLQRDGFLRRTTLLSISKDALEWVARRGYDAKMGGRALKRQIERDLTALTAEQLLQIPSDTPVILEVLLRNNALTPVLEPLRFAPALRRTWMPRLNTQRPGRQINELLKRVRGMQSELSSSELNSGNLLHASEGRAQWAFFHHKEKLAQLQEKLEHLLLHTAQLHSLPAMRFGLASFFQEDELVHLRDAQAEDLLDRSVISQLAETYRLSNPLWDQQESGLLEAWVDLQLLEQDQRAVNQQQMDDLFFALRSRSNEIDPTILQWLQEQYRSLFNALDLNADWHRGRQAFHLTGFGLEALLRPEVGIHLFYTAHQSPIPVQVSLESEAQESSSEIIRLYENRQVLTDLRSGLSSAVPLSPAEWKVLLYAGSQVREFKPEQ